MNMNPFGVTSMAEVIDSIEYSVCEDCILNIAHDLTDHDIGDDIEHELAGRKGFFVCGVEPTEDDPEGYGEDEFSAHQCELCSTTLAGRRCGATLLITEE
jgi:hypothetical protein